MKKKKSKCKLDQKIKMVILKDGNRLTSKEYNTDEPKDREVGIIIDNKNNRLTPSEWRSCKK